MNEVNLKDKTFEVFITDTEIAEIVHSMVNAINNSGIKDPLFIAVMNGAFLFAADVMRKITIPNAEISFIMDTQLEEKEFDKHWEKYLELIEKVAFENLNLHKIYVYAFDLRPNLYTILQNNNSDFEKLSKAIGKSKSHISNIVRLLELDEEILNYIILGKLSMGHARALIGVPNAIELANEIINKNLSVRQTEKNTANYKKNKNRKTSKDPNILDLEKELSEKIGLKTSIHFNEEGSSGSLTLYYSDLDQLDNLMTRLKK